MHTVKPLTEQMQADAINCNRHRHLAERNVLLKLGNCPMTMQFILLVN